MPSIAANTVFTYARLVMVAFCGFITTRLLLQRFGLNDYGLFAALTAVVAFSDIVTTSLNAAIQRNLAYDLGTGDADRARSTFFASQVTLLAWAALVLFVGLLARTLALRALHMPPQRLAAATVAYWAVLSQAFLNIASGAVFATFVAEQRFGLTATFEVASAMANLLCAYFLRLIPAEPLLVYPCLLATSKLLFVLLAGVCWRGSLPRGRADRRMLGSFRRIGGYAGWSLVGYAADQVRTNGAVLAMNAYFGPAVNAAYSLALKINSIQSTVAYGAAQPMQPAITGAVARGDQERVKAMTIAGSKFPALASVAMLTPLMFEMDTLLRIWLHDPPPNAALFARLLCASTAVFFLVNGYGMALVARGEIAVITFTNSVLQALSFGVVILLWSRFKVPWFLPASTFVFFVVIVCWYPFYVGWRSGLSPRAWAVTVLRPTLIVAAAGFASAAAVSRVLPSGLARLALSTLVSSLAAFLVAWRLALTRTEREWVLQRLARIRAPKDPK